jgi:hypothetical protein
MSVSSVSSTSNSADLLAILRQQYLAKQASSASNVSSLLDNDGDSQGSTPASSATGTTPAATTTGSGTSPLSQTIIAVLIEVQGQQSSATGGAAVPAGAADPSSFAQKLFNSVDTNGDGQISKSELESAFTTGGGTASQADAFFSKLDSNGDGSVSQSELTTGLQQAHHGHGHHHAAPAGGSGSSDPLAALLQAIEGSTTAGGTAQSATNADGSTTTTLAYADGAKVTLTTPATSAASSTSNGTASAASGDSAASNSTPSNPESLLMTLIRAQEQAFQSNDPSGQAITSLAA